MVTQGKKQEFKRIRKKNIFIQNNEIVSQTSPDPAQTLPVQEIEEVAQPMEGVGSLTKPTESLLTNLLTAKTETCESSAKQKKLVVFVSPILPHSSELDLWNLALAKTEAEGLIITSVSEKKSYDNYLEEHDATKASGLMPCVFVESVQENPTFLAGMEQYLKNATLVVTVGEASLASFQVLKIRRQLQNRMIVWQAAPRPPEANPRSLNPIDASASLELARLKSIRREVLKACDAVVTFDKDSSTWAYLEGVNAQRIRRITRGIDLNKFSVEMNATQRIALRASLGLPEADFIFLQAGPLEIETGALDTVYAFKSLLQSNPGFINTTKLVFCGTGSAGVEVRQAVVDLQLDDHVYFLNLNDNSTKEMLGNKMANLLGICDAVIHNPLTVVNGHLNKNLDCTYDILCALASGLSVISNGNGWVGEWIARLLNTFATGSIHSQAKLMRDSIDKQERLLGLKKGIRKAMEKELEIDKSAKELASIFQSLLTSELAVATDSITAVFAAIEETINAKCYLDTIQLISKAFENKNLSSSQRATLYRYIGDSFTKLGDMNSGMQNYLRALELDPYCEKSFIGLGTISLQRRDHNLALTHFQRAIALSPNDDLAHLGLALAFEGLNKLYDAYTLAQKACNLNLENTAAIFNLVRISYEIEEYTQAEVILSRYISIHPYDVNMTFALAGIEFKLNKFDLATKLIETILMLDPTNARANGLLTQINRKCSERKQA